MEKRARQVRSKWKNRGKGRFDVYGANGFFGGAPLEVLRRLDEDCIEDAVLKGRRYTNARGPLHTISAETLGGSAASCGLFASDSYVCGSELVAFVADVFFGGGAQGLVIGVSRQIAIAANDFFSALH